MTHQQTSHAIHHAAGHPLQQPMPQPIHTTHGLQQPQTFFNNDIFAHKEDRNRQIRREEQRHQNIAIQAQRLYGPDARITQAQYDQAAMQVDQMEHEESRQREDVSRMLYEEAKPAWLRHRTIDASSPASSPAASGLPPPPPPLPPATSFPPPSLHPPTSLEDIPRSAMHRSSSPRMYGATSQHLSSSLPPPPPPFAGRPMMPPSSPPFGPQSHQGRDGPPSSFGAMGRDLPTPSAKASSMSISSMLGTEPPRSRDISATPNGVVHHQSFTPSVHHSSASSPTKSLNGNEVQYRNGRDVQSQLPPSLNRFRAYSGGAPPNENASVKSDSPLHSKFNRLSSGSLTHVSPRSDQDPSQAWRQRLERHSDPGRLTERPNSQPSGPHTSIEEINRRNMDVNARPIVGRNEPVHEATSSSKDHEQSSYKSLNRLSQPESATAASSRFQSGLRGGTVDGRMHASSYPFLSNKSLFSESGSGGQPPENVSLQNDEERRSHTQQGPWPPEALRRIREERLSQNQGSQLRATPNESRPRLLDALDGRSTPDEQKYPQGVLLMERSESFDRAIAHARDGENGHRSSLALMLEHSRRVGGISPLPQAVQGAQGQSHGPSRDPSIKNEFNKVFVGLGTGRVGSGASTPFQPPSPKQNGINEPRLAFSARNEIAEISTKSRNGSKLGNKRSRKPKDGVGKDLDGFSKVDGSNGKGGKRARHHHHAPGHHHHHYRIDERTGTPIRVIGDPAATNHHHHHHKDGTIHYHTHGNTASTPQPHSKHKIPAPRMPKMIINNSPLLKSVAHLPHHHLGSVLYHHTVDPAISSKLPSTEAHFTIPTRFFSSGKENCTLTIRIPRFYLSHEQREAICRTRAAWGTEVYTDDSDPLAAAIHAGWVRGSWGSDFDPLMQDIDGGDENSPPNGTKNGNLQPVTALPSHPLSPPPHIDLHLTLLVLPPLQKYSPSVRHGIKSRDWGDDHQGLSFMVQKLAWVKEGAMRGVERGGKERRKRISALMNGARSGPVLKWEKRGKEVGVVE